MLGTQTIKTIAHLGIELDVGGAQANKACEQGLVQVTVFLEGHILDHRRQLVVVPDQDHPLQASDALLLILHRSSVRWVSMERAPRQTLQ